MRRRVVGGLTGVVLMWACGVPEVGPAIPESVPPAETGPVLADDGGRLYLRLDAGSILRLAPATATTATTTAAAAHVTARRDTLLVLARQGDWYQVRTSEPATEGWIQLTGREARARALRVAGSGAPRQATTANREVIAEARNHMRAGGRAGRCGPYELFTDVTDGALVAACQRIGEALDDHVHRLYGAEPRGQPAEAILLFDRRNDFRAFAEPRGTFRLGYAAYARGSEGFLAAFVGGQPTREVVQTLAHELTHLVLRRTFGTDLPRWLAEGLADGVGDVASVDGLRRPRGAAGIEAELQRLGHGDRAGRLEGLARLTSMDDAQFDAGTVSYDYEQSAVFVRWLLIDPERGRCLRTFLSGLAAGRAYEAEALRQALGRSWDELDRSLRSWMRGHD